MRGGGFTVCAPSECDLRPHSDRFAKYRTPLGVAALRSRFASAEAGASPSRPPGERGSG
ncbi:MAG: hypothetical protein IJX92_06605 [Clostridia bacterium]|nr:hypothetical protein [Clostridia bacterium]